MKISDKLTWRYAGLYLVIILLIVFANPEIKTFIIGLIPICIGEIIRFWSAGYLRKDKKLTFVGPYAYVKNPLYLGTLLIMTGVCICAGRWESLIFGLAWFFLYYFPRKRRIEEARLLELFGKDYEEYLQSIPALVPRLTPYQKEKGIWNFRVIRENSEHLTLLVILLGVILIGRKLFL